MSKGLLTFEKTILNVAPHEEQRPVVDYIRGDEKGVIHRILTVQPRTKGIEQDPVFEMWCRNRDTKMSLQDMRLLSASVFLIEKGSPENVPTYEVRTLREALRSEHWAVTGGRLARLSWRVWPNGESGSLCTVTRYRRGPTLCRASSCLK